VTNYRWNVPDYAVGYDESAASIHPHYLELQGQVLDLLGPTVEAKAGEFPLLSDLGGGSGRLMERCLDRFPVAKGIVIDQSEAFLALAERRLARFGDRAKVVQLRLQDFGPTTNDQSAIVSMSAIHHLLPDEKRELYQRCYEALAPGGVFINADEVRPASDEEHLRELGAWWEHMQRGLASGQIVASMRPILEAWRERNIDRYAEPRKSGDDNHETAEAQLDYLRDAGFENVRVVWTKSLWAVMVGERARSSR
jgi:tRNA (cmo5U34)-methyltransferase